MAKQNKPHQPIDGYTGKPIKGDDQLGVRRAELLQIVCALVGDQDTLRTLTREGIVQEAKQFLELIDNECC
jgi:hypothetical protein